MNDIRVLLFHLEQTEIKSCHDHLSLQGGAAGIHTGKRETKLRISLVSAGPDGVNKTLLALFVYADNIHFIFLNFPFSIGS